MKKIFLYVLLTVISCVSGGNIQSIFAAQADTPIHTHPSIEAEGANAANSATYKIGSGDVLEINVWREPMLSGELVVRNDGMISFTLLGDVQAAGRTSMDLKNEIQSRLKDYISEPVVTVIVRTPVSQKFYVVGEVRTPGEYDLIKDLTVIQAIARAGGFTEWADKGDIVLLRKENGMEKRIRVNYKAILKGKSADQNMLLQANDTIIVP